MIAGTPLEGDAQGHGHSRRWTGSDVGVPGGRGGLDKAGVEAEGRTAPLVAASVKAFTAAKQAASNGHEGTATSSQQKVGGPSLVDRVLYYKAFRKGAVSPVHARQQQQQQQRGCNKPARRFGLWVVSTPASLVSLNLYLPAARSSHVLWEQSLRSASRWREVGFGGASTTREETWITMEILAHSVRWSEMCDRWLSNTRDRERFAPDVTPAVPLGATVDRSGAF